MPEKRVYQCDSCGYEFSSYTYKKICPYCGKKGKIKPLKTAEEIIEEV